MAVPSNTLQTVAMTGVKESLVDEVNILSKAEARFWNATKAGDKPKAQKHEFLTDSIRAGASNAKIEGDTIDATAQGEPTRLYNMCQTVGDSYIVSSMSNAVTLAGRESARAYDRMKCLKGLLRDINYSALRGVRVDGAAGTAGVMRGALNWCQTNSDYGDGTQAATGVITGGTARDLTNTLLKSVLQDIFTAGGGRKTLTAWMNVFQQTKFDEMLSINNNRQMVEANKIDDYVSVYTTAFGAIKAEVDIEMPADQVLIADMDYWKKCTLEPMMEKEVGTSVLHDKYDIATTVTLEACNELSSGRIAVLTTA